MTDKLGEALERAAFAVAVLDKEKEISLVALRRAVKELLSVAQEQQAEVKLLRERLAFAAEGKCNEALSSERVG